MRRASTDQISHEDTKKRKVYPLDQLRHFVGSFVDKDGFTHKQFELTNPSDEMDKILIEILVRDPNEPLQPKEATPIPDVIPEKTQDYPEHAIIEGTRIFGRSSLSPRFRSLIEDTPIYDVSLHDNTIVFASENETVTEIFSKLVKNNFLSLPVYNNDRKFVGFIDILDILSYLSDKIVDFQSGEFENVSFWATWHSVQDVGHQPCKGLVNISKRNPNFCAYHVLDDMGVLNLHRIGILKNNTLVAILSQTNLLEFFFKHDFLTDIGNIAAMTVGQLQLGYKKVQTTTLNTRTIDAFRSMVEHQVSGLGIKDEKGKLVGNISASDIRELGYEFNVFSKLFVSIKDFFGKNMKKLQCVRPESTFQDDERILGVITPSDIFKCFQSKPHNPFGVDNYVGVSSKVSSEV